MDLDSILTAISKLRGTHTELTAILCAAERMVETGLVSEMAGSGETHDAIIDAIIKLDECYAEEHAEPSEPRSLAEIAAGQQ